MQLYSAYDASISIGGAKKGAFFDIEMKIPDLIHCVYKNESNQIVIPRMDERVYDYHDYYKLQSGDDFTCRMIRKYQEVYSHMLKNQVGEEDAIDDS